MSGLVMYMYNTPRDLKKPSTYARGGYSTMIDTKSLPNFTRYICR